MPPYLQQGYNHSGWLSSDGMHYFLCYETHGQNINVLSLSDLSDIKPVATMNAQSASELEIPHNVYLQENLLYTAYYYDGLQVYDVSVPEFPRRIAYYDTYDGPHRRDYEGAWGVYVLPSGRVLISDIYNGLFFFEAINAPPDNWVTPRFAAHEYCIGASSSISARVGTDFELSSVELSTENTSPALEVSLSATRVMSGERIEIEVTGRESGWHDIVINAKAGNTESSSIIPIKIIGPPTAPNLQRPPDGSELVLNRPFFSWLPPQEEPDYFIKLQVSFSLDDFESAIFFDEEVSNNEFLLPYSLDPGAPYYWRLWIGNPCGSAYSEIYSFTIRGNPTDASEIAGNPFRLFPNPASSFLRLEFSQAPQEALLAEWWNSSGQFLQAEPLHQNNKIMNLSINGLPAGMYTLRLSSSAGSTSKKIIIKN